MSGTSDLSQVQRHGDPELAFKVYMSHCKVFSIEWSNQGFLTQLSHLPRSKVPDRPLASDKLAFFQQRDVSRCQLLKRHMLLIVWDFDSYNVICGKRINEPLPTGIEQTRGGECRPTAPRPWCLTPFSQDPIVGTTAPHWSLETCIFASYKRVFFQFFSND